MTKVDWKNQSILRLHSSLPRVGSVIKVAKPFRLASLLLACVALAGLNVPARSQQAATLAGFWTGLGVISSGLGAGERARCHAHYAAKSETTFLVTARCATGSGPLSQTANLRKVSENTYAGSFYNEEYNISGRMQVVVRGDTQRVTLISSSATAAFTMKRTASASM
jgi:hypothetical protein